MTARCAPLAFFALTLLLSGCRKPAVETYRVTKDTSAPAPTPPAAGAPSGGAAPSAPFAQQPAGGSAMANTAVTTASGADLVWKAPAHWKTKTGSAMRKGSYTVTAEGMEGEADLSITAFPGDVGGDLANLNRWRGQVKLPPVSQAEFETTTQHLDRGELHMTFAELVGTGNTGKPERILGAMVPHAGATWFFKMQGPDALVAKEKAAFMALLDTVKPAAAK